MTSSHEFTGKSVDDAIQAGLAQLGLREDQVEIEIVSKGSRGIFGIGSEPALVRISPRPARPSPPVTPPLATPVATPAPAPLPAPKPAAPPPVAPPAEAIVRAEPPVTAEAATEPEPEEAAEKSSDARAASEPEVEALAVDLLQGLVQRMGFEAQVTASWASDDDGEGERYLNLDLHGEELGSLIGRRGETLENLQYLLRLMVNQHLHHWNNIVVDVEHYKRRRVDQLNQLALRMADQVVQTGRSISLEPMPASERRIVHMALRDHPQVYTESSGDGERRKVHILPRSRG